MGPVTEERAAPFSVVEARGPRRPCIVTVELAGSLHVTSVRDRELLELHCRQPRSEELVERSDAISARYDPPVKRLPAGDAIGTPDRPQPAQRVLEADQRAGGVSSPA